jgi:hypothetical protein
MLSGPCRWTAVDDPGKPERGKVTRAIVAADRISLDIESSFGPYTVVLTFNGVAWVGNCAGADPKYPVHVQLDRESNGSGGYVLDGKWREGTFFDFWAEVDDA